MTASLRTMAALRPISTKKLIESETPNRLDYQAVAKLGHVVRLAPLP